MKRFTAAEAKALAGKTADECVDDLLIAIKAAAEQKKRSLRTGWDYKADQELWVHGGYKPTENWKKAKEILEKLGFDVTFYYSEGSFAVDMYTLIKW